MRGHSRITPDGIRYRCKRVPYDSGLSPIWQVPAAADVRDSPLNQVRPRPTSSGTVRFLTALAKWKVLYNKRVSVERVFSRLKTYRKLDAIRTRRLPKVWLHVALEHLGDERGGSGQREIGLGNLRKCVA